MERRVVIIAIPQVQPLDVAGPAGVFAAVARRCGFGMVETMRRASARRLGVSPGAYRDRFAA